MEGHFRKLINHPFCLYICVALCGFNFILPTISFLHSSSSLECGSASGLLFLGGCCCFIALHVTFLCLFFRFFVLCLRSEPILHLLLQVCLRSSTKVCVLFLIRLHVVVWFDYFNFSLFLCSVYVLNLFFIFFFPGFFGIKHQGMCFVCNFSAYGCSVGLF